MRPARWLLAAALPLFAACTILDKAPGAQPEVEAEAPAGIELPLAPRSEVVTYLARLRSMNDSAITRETARARQALARSATDLNRLRLAMALTLSAQSDEGEILGLVEPVARKDSAPHDVRAMASFLHVVASERRRLKESAAASNTRLREERRAVEAQKQRADSLQERATQLQQKLDALTELEKSLSDRQVPNR